MVEAAYEADVKVYTLYGDIPDERCEEEVKLP